MHVCTRTSHTPHQTAQAKAKAEAAAPSPTPNNGDSDFETLEEFYAHLKTCTKKKKKKESDEVQAGPVT